MTRRFVKLILASVAVLASVATGWAYWTGSVGTGTGSGSVGTLAAPTNVAVSPDPSTGTHTVSWDAAAVTPTLSGITYTVERRLAADAEFGPITGGDCATPPSSGTLECDDTVTTSGDYYYRVVAKFRSWTAESDPVGPVDVTVNNGPPAPVSVALANGGGIGDAYINGANASSVSVAVGLENSTAGDVVAVTITDADEETTERTATAGGGATETVTVTGIDASALEDGSVTLHATSSDGSGTSPEATTAVTKDTVKPSSAASSVANITSGTTFTVPYTSGDAAPSSTLDKVELYVDDPAAGGFALVSGVTDTTPSASGESFSYTGATQDGTYGFYTRATDKAGNVEDAPGVADQTATRDTDPSPTGVDVQTTNAGGSSGAGRLRSGDALVLTFSEAIKSTSILSTWTNPAVSAAGQMILKQNGATDRLETLGSLNIGIIGLENFVDNNDVTFNVTLTLNSARTVLTVTFGSNSGSGTLRNGSAGAAEMQWTPDEDITDDSNQGIDTTQVTEGGGSDSDF
jgi:hypothetical protein